MASGISWVRENELKNIVTRKVLKETKLPFFPCIYYNELYICVGLGLVDGSKAYYDECILSYTLLHGFSKILIGKVVKMELTRLKEQIKETINSNEKET